MLKNVNIRTVSASSGLRFLRHWMNGSETTMGFAVKAASKRINKTRNRSSRIVWQRISTGWSSTKIK